MLHARLVYYHRDPASHLSWNATMRVDSRPVLIAGAGPVGLVLAWRLARAGLPVRIFEREPQLIPMLRSSTIHPPTLDMLDEDGVSEALHAAGRVTPTWQIRLHETGEHAEFDLSIIADATRHPWRLQCDQSVLSIELEKRLNALDPSIVRRGVQVVAAGEDDEGPWIEWQTGESAPVREHGSFVVGCDGGRSLIREAIGASFDGSVYPETTILATTTFPFEDHLPGLSGINYVWAPDGTYSLLRLPDVWRVSLHPPESEDLDDAMRPERISQRLAEITPAAAEAKIREIRPYRVHQRIASHWRRGKMLIAGDAAHLNNPKGGMGMNGGIHDVFELASCFAEIFAGAPASTIERYEARRRPVVRDDIIGQADQNRARMWESSLEGRRKLLADLQALAADRDRCYKHLLRTSMIEGLRRAATLA
jgi:2-polyprenyl-6-methoxyphenol hydroxylase-like FAD-dependent oxidoreductase